MGTPRYLLGIGKHWVSFILFPVRALLVKIARSRVVAEYQGIMICDLGAHPEKSSRPFADLTTDALSLIGRYDPIRFNRIKRSINYIVNEPIGTKFMFDPLSKRVGIHFVDEIMGRGYQHYDWIVAQHACVLVYDSTQGILYNRGIVYSKIIKFRYTNILQTQLKLFVNHLPLEDGYKRDLLGTLIKA